MTPQQEMDEIWNRPTVYRSDLFEGKVALVSGGGTGIGRATAMLFARLGAKVAICGRTPEKLDAVVDYVTAKGAQMIGVPTNVKVPESVDELFDRIRSEYGRLDMTVNNAGGQFPQDAIDFADKGWKAVIDNNLNGTWFMMQRAARQMKTQFEETGVGGSIVNITLIVDRGLPGVAHTVASRAGVIGAMNTVAVEWAPYDIRVNCVAPGLTATKGLDVYPPEAVKEFPLANPMRRPGTAWEMAEACIYLSGPSGSFITGEVLDVDGGGKLWGEIWCAGRPEYYRNS